MSKAEVNDRYQEGYDDGYSKGHEEGDEEGYERGYDSGSENSNDGWQDGYDSGKDEFITELKPAFENFITEQNNGFLSVGETMMLDAFKQFKKDYLDDK